MSLEDKVNKALQDLGVSTPEALQELFAEISARLDDERQALIAQGAADERERSQKVKELRDRWLARKGGIVSLIDENWLKKSPTELKPAVGRAFNALRGHAAAVDAEELLQEVPLRGGVTRERGGAADARHAAPHLDLTLPGYRRPLGSVHPVTQVMREIEDIFLGLGFSIESGPEIESVYYNFDALNIPESHPARDDWDTLYVNSETVLRTHTSPVRFAPWRSTARRFTSFVLERRIGTITQTPPTPPCSTRWRGWRLTPISALPT